MALRFWSACFVGLGWISACVTQSAQKKQAPQKAALSAKRGSQKPAAQKPVARKPVARKPAKKAMARATPTQKPAPRARTFAPAPRRQVRVAKKPAARKTAARKTAARVAPRWRPPVGKKPKNMGSFQFSLQEVKCQGCRQSFVMKSRGTFGIHEVHMSGDDVCIHFDASRTNPAKIMKSLTAMQITCAYEKARKKVRWPKKMDVRLISKKGEDVLLTKHLVRGKVTIVDFYADWCAPCRQLDYALLKIMKKRKDIALRKVNIVDFSKPAARRYLRKSNGLPYVLIYDRKGKRVAAISGFDLDALKKGIRRAL